jgi:hypothetical protein
VRNFFGKFEFDLFETEGLKQINQTMVCLRKIKKRIKERERERDIEIKENKIICTQISMENPK